MRNSFFTPAIQSVIAFFKSIRFRFIFWYTLILSITFLLFSFTLYHYFKYNLYKEFDNRLQLRAEGIVHSIETYWETEKMEARKYGSVKDVYNKINNANFVKIAQRWVKDKSNNLDLTNLIVHLYNSSCEIIATKEVQLQKIILPKSALEVILKGNQHLDNYEIGDEKNPYRVFSMPVMENGVIAYIVQVAAPLISTLSVLNKLKILLFILLPLTVLTTSLFAGEFLASITLKPLEKMIETVQQITENKTQLRITLPETKDEIKQLAETFNGMLEKIDRSMWNQKQFIQDISHELRTPLTVLKGEFETTLKRVRSREEYISVLQSNLEEIDKINRMVEDLLILARYDNDQMQIKTVVFDIGDMLRDLVEDMSLIASQKNIRMNLSCSEGNHFSADKEKIRMVIIILIDNAIKYTPENGTITVEVSREENKLKITVRDTGIGIGKEDRQLIFNRFFQVDRSRKTQGFGLGLSIAKSIVEAHQGSIQVDSEPGKGSLFTVRLPLTASVL